MAVALAVLLIGTNPAGAQMAGSPAEGITVTAVGEALVKPNKLELEINTAVSAELTADAVVKYRDMLKRTKETIEKLKIDNLEVSERGVNVASTVGAATNVSYVMQGRMVMATAPNNDSAVKPEVSISKSLRLCAKGIDKLSEEQVIALVAKLLDGVKDAGLAARPDPNNPDGQPGPGAVVMFIADDLAAARKKATEQAFSRAKDKAQRIAELAGGHLGAATAVDEVPAGSVEEVANEPVPTPVYAPGANNAGSDGTRLSSPTLAEVPVRVGLQVRFKLQPAEVAK